uniref:Uncharacterized protein n=1 Tax=Trypanosoma congolense (strain IL3000) TaxID=1068625 RepID=G0V064_TRYCI|nr:hypothetical protein, unlikely [Trypanosoma congolense IL3000]
MFMKNASTAGALKREWRKKKKCSRICLRRRFETARMYTKLLDQSIRHQNTPLHNPKVVQYSPPAQSPQRNNCSCFHFLLPLRERIRHVTMGLHQTCAQWPSAYPASPLNTQVS